MIFGLGKNKSSTLEEVRKAYGNLSDDDKKSFEQSIKSRVDESVGEQEHASGTEDSQTAKDRVDEAEGAEKAAEYKEEGAAEAEGKSTEKSMPTAEPTPIEESASAAEESAEREEVTLLKAILAALTKPSEKTLSPEEQVKKNVGNAANGLAPRENAGMPDDVSAIIEKMKNTK